MTISQGENLKFIFMGTANFSAVILEIICKAGFRPILAVTAQDKPVGRGQILTPPPVKLTAQKYNIPVLQPEKIEDSRLEIENCKPELIVTAAYGQILPQEILDIPEYGCLNIHPSLLPKYRGPSPIQTAILNGDRETGVTIILMDGRIDHGPILAQKKTIIGFNETAKQLHDRLAVLGAELLIDTIPDWVEGRIEADPQNEKEAIYTKILTREAGLIDWKKSPQEIDRQIRAFSPWPGTYTIYRKKRIKVLRSRLENGKLVIEEVQPEGKKPMSFEDFLLGNPNFKT